MTTFYLLLGIYVGGIIPVATMGYVDDQYGNIAPPMLHLYIAVTWPWQVIKMLANGR